MIIMAPEWQTEWWKSQPKDRQPQRLRVMHLENLFQCRLEKDSSITRKPPKHPFHFPSLNRTLESLRIPRNDLDRCHHKKAFSPPTSSSPSMLTTCWHVVRGDIMAFLVDFHERCAFKKSLNAIFISLLPKVAGANDIKKLGLSALWGVCTKF